jgi:hypothetical protein
LSDNTFTIDDRASESQVSQISDSAVPSLEEQQAFVGEQNGAPKEYKKVLTAENEKSFELYDSEIDPKSAVADFNPFGDDEEVTLQKVKREKPALGDVQPTGQDAPQDQPAVPTGDIQPDEQDDNPVVKMNPSDDGGVVAEFKDGTVSHTKDGNTTTVKPDGTIIESRQDGTQVQTNTDGSVTTEKDGLIEHKAPDGTITVVDVEAGTVVEKGPDGKITKSVTRDDGLVETDLPNGDKKYSGENSDGPWSITKHKDGGFSYESEKTGKRDYDKNGEVTVTKNDADGNTVVEDPDGSKRTYKPDGTTVFDDGKGKKSTFYPSGVIVDESKDGTKVTHGKDKSKLIETPDGKRTYQDPNGERRELDEDEEIAYRYR